ncbi:hypothetical protein DM02DRAFT_611413 [Periconia macrospinosa]|uniref:MYND-type domain-containing protein n=1 Tax=Periconia macrospinosa TaxID=97972 RepID=A0A2V1E354_9PLEO|nr:hypothetical protein DM02DRAFT_611413 [Periconia macrospinosa]
MSDMAQADASAASSSPQDANEPSVQPSPEETAKCAHCGKAPDAVKECNRCHSVSYCNKDCQKSHFKAHKKECASLAQAYMSKHTPKLASRAPPKETNRNTGFKKWQFDT